MSKERFLLSPLPLITVLGPEDSCALKKPWTLWSTTHPQRLDPGSPRLSRARDTGCSEGAGQGSAPLGGAGRACTSPLPFLHSGLRPWCWKLLPPSEDCRLDTQARGWVEGGEGPSGSKMLSGAAPLAVPCSQPDCLSLLVREVATCVFCDCMSIRMSVLRQRKQNVSTRARNSGR